MMTSALAGGEKDLVQGFDIVNRLPMTTEK
jgi:hypothetical protein